MPYDEKSRSDSDRVFFDNIEKIRKHTNIYGKIKESSKILDTRYAIDFICGKDLISYRTVDYHEMTFTFRIPPDHKPEIDKIRIVHDRIQHLDMDRLLIIVINTQLNTVAWCEPSDIFCVPLSEYITRDVYNTKTRMHVIYHNDIINYGGNVHIGYLG